MPLLYVFLINMVVFIEHLLLIYAINMPITYTIWSGWPDLNRRPLHPQCSALPGCATSRILLYLGYNI